MLTFVLSLVPKVHFSLWKTFNSQRPSLHYYKQHKGHKKQQVSGWSVCFQAITQSSTAGSSQNSSFQFCMKNVGFMREKKLEQLSTACGLEIKSELSPPAERMKKSICLEGFLEFQVGKFCLLALWFLSLVLSCLRNSNVNSSYWEKWAKVPTR